MFAIKEVQMGANCTTTVKLFIAFDAAKDYALSNYKIAFIEQDGDEAADFITEAGNVYAIEKA